MSIICTSNNGWLISHPEYVSSIYGNNSGTRIRFKDDLFSIHVPYKKKKIKQFKNEDKLESLTLNKEINYVEETYKKLYIEFKAHFKNTQHKDNDRALKLSEEIYEATETTLENTNGGNSGVETIQKLSEFLYLFPENCKFFCRPVEELHRHLPDEKFDLILLDPPWWNKYIRRKRKKTTHAYHMMYDQDLKQLNLDKLLTNDGLIAVWCTNSPQHLNSLIDDIFPAWGVKYSSKWYWLKVTLNGEPVCNFSEPPGKQPFEQIVFGCRNDLLLPTSGKIVVSVPSALHSHKPPLVELLKVYLPDKPECLEIFARYLLPNWTSYGNEVLKFQHESLYDIIKC